LKEAESSSQKDFTARKPGEAERFHSVEARRGRETSQRGSQARRRDFTARKPGEAGTVRQRQ
jgi:hypothetical protein